MVMDEIRGEVTIVELSDSPIPSEFNVGRFARTARPPRNHIDGDFKLVIYERQNAEPFHELFNLVIDPAEKTNLLNEQPARATKLHSQLRDCQQSVLKSLRRGDYGR